MDTDSNRSPKEKEMPNHRDMLKGVKIDPEIHALLKKRAKRDGMLFESLVDEVLRAGIKVKRLQEETEERAGE